MHIYAKFKHATDAICFCFWTFLANRKKSVGVNCIHFFQYVNLTERREVKANPHEKLTFKIKQGAKWNWDWNSQMIVTWEGRWSGNTKQSRNVDHKNMRPSIMNCIWSQSFQAWKADTVWKWHAFFVMWNGVLVLVQRYKLTLANCIRSHLYVSA